MKQTRIKGKLNKFINKDLKYLVKVGDKRLIVFRLSHNAKDWDVYKQVRNSMKTLLRTAQSNYVRNQIEKYKGNSRSMWKVIRECLPSRDSEKPIYQKDHKVLANEFNEYFASVGKTADDKVKKLAEVNNFQIRTALPPSRHQSLDLF